MEIKSLTNEALVSEFKRLVSLLGQTKNLKLLDIEREITRRIGDQDEGKKLITNLRNCIQMDKGGVKIAECEKKLLKILNSKKEAVMSNNPIPEEGFEDYY